MRGGTGVFWYDMARADYESQVRPPFLESQSLASESPSLALLGACSLLHKRRLLACCLPLWRHLAHHLAPCALWTALAPSGTALAPPLDRPSALLDRPSALLDHPAPAVRMCRKPP